MKEHEDDDVRQAFVFRHALLMYKNIKATDIISECFFFIALILNVALTWNNYFRMKSFTETRYSAHPMENLTVSHVHVNPRRSHIALFPFFFPPSTAVMDVLSMSFVTECHFVALL